MLLLAAICLLFRILVVCAPCTATVIISRLAVSSLVNGYILLVTASTADLFQHDSTVLAGFEGKTAATWGLAYAVGMVLGGRVFAAGVNRATLRVAYLRSSCLATAALLLTLLGVRETLHCDSRERFELRGLSPLGFIRLFRRGKVLCSLACILGLQALHDGEGDMWQVFSEATRGWDAKQNAAYGAAVGVATTCCGLLTGFSVRHLGNRLHTVLWTLATAVSTVMFTSPSTRVAMASVPFGCAEDTMQAAATARLVQAGAAQGMRKGQLAADYGNLVAVVRVFGLYFFGKLCSVGMSTGMPQLPYFICAALQLVAVALVFTLPAASWQNAAVTPLR